MLCGLLIEVSSGHCCHILLGRHHWSAHTPGAVFTQRNEHQEIRMSGVILSQAILSQPAPLIYSLVLPIYLSYYYAKLRD
jgi:hypothetical protein